MIYDTLKIPSFPLQVSATCFEFGSIVMIISLLAANCLIEVAAFAPAIFLMLAGLISKNIDLSGIFFMIFAAIPLPMFPKPINPTELTLRWPTGERDKCFAGDRRKLRVVAYMSVYFAIVL